MGKQEVIAPGALTRREWAARINEKYLMACAGMRQAIFALGYDLLDAKDSLKHGEFKKMIGDAHANGELRFKYRAANMFMAIVRDDRVSEKCKLFALLPPHYPTIYKITRLSDDVLDRLVHNGTIGPDTSYADINKVLRLERVARDEAIVRKLKPNPGKYRTLVIDPAWDYDNLSLSARAKADYAKQTLESLRMLDLMQWAEPQCHLYCWATNNYLYEALKLVEGWGFQYRLTLAWNKPPPFGLGSYYRHSWEPCIFATLGETTTTPAAASIPTHFEAPRGQHSEKPEAFYEIVRKASYPPYGEGNQRVERSDFESIFRVTVKEDAAA